ncbi:MAG: acyl-CoA thioesterase [Deltaproteobacteria bacterium]|jgi:acyl-CoA thioester hydrolase|nr:acyl-CoA thioesterase [Deltaproteobacteria bacterium]
MFHIHHKVQFYETDQMGIVHHSNYLRFCEEARVAWAHNRGLIDYQKPQSAAHFAVLETQVKHLKPAFFGDDLKILVQARGRGIRIEFQYKILKEEVVVVLAQTTHVPLNADLKPIKISQEMKRILEGEAWKEIWP